MNKFDLREPPARTPRLTTGCDIRSLPLGPQEAFLLSRIDGYITESELSSVTGFDAEFIAKGLQRLVEMGVVQLDVQQGDHGGSVTTTQRSPHVAVNIPPPPGSEPEIEVRIAQATEPPLSYRIDELEEAADLDFYQKKDILDLFYQLPLLDHYQLLGVASAADKKEIKKAYYTKAPNYHPDKFFRKNLGSFKTKMEVIFGQLTMAYETLASRERRGEYDSYLVTQRRNQTLEQLLHEGEIPGALHPVMEAISAPPPSYLPPSTSGTVSALGAARMNSDPAAAPATPLTNALLDSMKRLSAAPITYSSPPPTLGDAGPFGSEPPATISSPPPSSVLRDPAAEKSRREILARRLRAGTSAKGVPSSTPPPSQSQYRSAALTELQRMRGAKLGSSKSYQVKRYIDAGRLAMDKHDPASAANAYRLALNLEPENAEVVLLHRDASRLAAELLSDGYLKQATYEAREGHWAQAAHSYVRAAAGLLRNADVQRRAADALLRAGADLHQAAEHARRAVNLEPKDVEHRLTLAEVYWKAGLTSAAKRELESAKELAPDDQRVGAFVKKMKAGIPT